MLVGVLDERLVSDDPAHVEHPARRGLEPEERASAMRTPIAAFTHAGADDGMNRVSAHTRGSSVLRGGFDARITSP